jgi:predicted DsbA family dithiol-disulfide isomerase
MHDKSYDAAVAAEAAGMQGKFWAMQDQLFTNQQAWSGQGANNKQIWLDYAEKIGLDVQRFQADITGLAAKSRVDQDIQRAKALNVSSTPSLFVNNQLVPLGEMNTAGLRRIIDAELQKAAPSQTQTSSSTTAPVNSGNGNSKSK